MIFSWLFILNEVSFFLRNAFRRLKPVNKWSCAALLHVPCLIQFMFIIYAGSEKMLLDLNGDSDWNLVICDPCFLHPVAVTMHHHPFSCGFLTLYCTCHPISLKYLLGAGIIISLGRENKLSIKQAFDPVGSEKGTRRKTFTCAFS